jgi:hypothetical protein
VIESSLTVLVTCLASGEHGPESVEANAYCSALRENEIPSGLRSVGSGHGAMVELDTVWIGT